MIALPLTLAIAGILAALIKFETEAQAQYRKAKGATR